MIWKEEFLKLFLVLKENLQLQKIWHKKAYNCWTVTCSIGTKCSYKLYRPWFTSIMVNYRCLEKGKNDLSCDITSKRKIGSGRRRKISARSNNFLKREKQLKLQTHFPINVIFFSLGLYYKKCWTSDRNCITLTLAMKIYFLSSE